MFVVFHRRLRQLLRPSPRPALAAAWLAVFVSLVYPGATPPARAAGSEPPDGIRVSGNRLVTGEGRPIRLVGVNRSGTEYACIRGWGVFEGPTDNASIQVIRSWHANAVRIGLNEDCWLGINGVPPALAGTNYQQAIIDYVSRLTANGMYAIIDLHWSAPGSAPATSLRQMPDEDHSLEFWRSVATAFVDNPNVLFDVFNEPFGVDWDCWRDGCVFPGGPGTGPWQTVGMQSLVSTIRATGAPQPILLGGLAFANEVSEWRNHQPEDPLGQLVASIHIYPFNACSDSGCWDETVAPLAESVPVVIGEVGTNWSWPYSDAMALGLMRWADDHQLSYLAWAWNAWGDGDALLTSYTGSSTGWGTDVKMHLAERAVPRLRSLWRANAAYTRHDLGDAIMLYRQAASAVPSEEESDAISSAIDGLAGFREVVSLTAMGDEEQAHQRLELLLDTDASGTFARLAAQFWHEYGMTTSVRAACAQLAPQVDTQAGALLKELDSLGVHIRHDELCVVP